MNIGFWNLNKKNIGSLLKEFCQENDIDILVLGEAYSTPNEILLTLNEDSNDYFFAPNIVCEKILFFTKFDPVLFPLIEETNRICARQLYSPKYGDISIIAAHYNSKVNWSLEDQAANIPIFKNLIDSVEIHSGHKRTIVFGDFNLNPFDSAMVQSTGLHAVMDRKIAKKNSRTIEDNPYDYFYNPMWGFLGDNGKGNVSGTIYYSPSKPINFHWHLFDQVIIRPSLIDDFPDDELDIITNIGTTKLLTTNDIISRKYSDHLPLKFKIEI